MITDRKEIESVLQIGEKILLDHPELYGYCDGKWGALVSYR